MQLQSTITKLAIALALVVLTAPIASAADIDGKAQTQKHECKIVHMIKHLFGCSAGSSGTTTTADDAPSLDYPPSTFIITR